MSVQGCLRRAVCARRNPPPSLALAVLIVTASGRVAALDLSIPLINAQFLHDAGIDGDNTTICLIDTGLERTPNPVQVAHDALVNAVVDTDGIVYRCLEDPNRPECTPNGIPCPTGPCVLGNEGGSGFKLPLDLHGTNTAGILVAREEVPGLRGVAPGALLYSIRVQTRPPDEPAFVDSESVISAINRCRQRKNQYSQPIRVIHISIPLRLEADNPLTNQVFSSNCDDVTGSKVESAKAAIDEAVEAGMVVVAPSGSDGRTTGISFPACLSNVVAVGSTYNVDLGFQSYGICIDSGAQAYPRNLTCYTNRHDNLELVAPGSEVFTTSAGPNGYTLVDGTEFAAAMASGVAALLFDASELFGNIFTAEEVAFRLRNSTVLPRTADPSEPNRSFAFLDAFTAAVDRDSDSIPDELDKCPSYAQSDVNQTDTNGDGIPDECQCGDSELPPNGSISGQDVLKTKRCFLQLDNDCDISIADTDGNKALTGQDVLKTKRVLLQLDPACSLKCERGGFKDPNNPDDRPACLPEVEMGDSDLVMRWTDNCPDYNNPNQTDTDSDGIGDLCQCGDANEDGVVDDSDLATMFFMILAPQIFPPSPLCDTEDDETCDADDYFNVQDYIDPEETPLYCARYPGP